MESFHDKSSRLGGWSRRGSCALLRRLGAWTAMFAVVPFAVEVEPVDRDSSFTTFTFGAGTGSYAHVTRGCEGQILSSEEFALRDVGFGVEHETGSTVLGFRASGAGSEYVAEGADGVWLLNPHVAHEGRKIGLGFGAMIKSETQGHGGYYDALVGHDVLPVSGHLRFGNRARGTDFLISLGENVPALSPGGQAEITQGFRISRVVGGRVGVAGPVPFDSPGLIVRAHVRPTDALGVELRGRFGSAGGASESTVGLALSYRIRHGSP
jgi:hypothetical protein